MENIFIFGHKNPDTDTICSALAYEIVKKQLGVDVKAVRLGNVNDETQYVLDFLNIDAPELIDNVSGKHVILVDHNEFGQSCDGIEEAHILEVIDHHRVANFKTNDPLYMNVQPVGCTATIIYEMAQNKKISVDAKLATLLLSAIISDTLLFKSPTCTQMDVDTANELAEIVDFDIEKYGLEMLKAGTNLSKYSAEELLGIDAKEFNTDNGLFKVAQVNTVDIEDFKVEFLDDVKKQMTNDIEVNKLDMFVLMVTDIVNSNSLAVVIGNKSNVFEKNFNIELVDDMTMLEGVVSRKKQIVPFL
jgi:manganese-dependent inorganic pyrophosphatase